MTPSTSNLGTELGAFDDPAEAELVDEQIESELASAPPWAFQNPTSASREHARSRDSIYRRMLAAADGAALALALVLAITVVAGASLTAYSLLLFPAMIVFAKALGLYDRDQHVLHKSTLDEIPKLFQLSILVAFGISLLESVLIGGEAGGAAALVLAITLFAGLIASRSIARKVARPLSRPERCVVIGDKDLADDLAQKVVANGGTTVEFVGCFDGSLASNGDSPEPYDGITRFLVEHDIDRVVLAPEAEHRSDMLGLVGEIKSLGVKISVLPSVSQAGGTSFELDRIDGITLLGLRGFEFSRSSRILKRSLDIAIAGGALLMLAPAFVAIAITIKIDSRGSIFYRQRRVGRHGELFQMLKFRTMEDRAHERRESLSHLNEAIGGLFKIENDPRITKVGAPLRRLSFDELPQLWNVLKGDMSLVGPRPLVVEEDRLVRGWHRQRLALTPGMTGYWQVLGSTRVPLDEMVKLDYVYVQNWSAWEDIKLLMRTVPLVAKRQGI